MMSGRTNRNSIEFLCIGADTTFMDVLRIHGTAARHGLPAGIALVTDKEGRLLGTVTDGDVRRALLKHGDLNLKARDAMQTSPIVFSESLSFREIIDALPEELRQRGRNSQVFLGKIVLTNTSGQPTRVLDYHQLWEQRVASHRHVIVMGLGYVGFTLGLKLAEQNIRVTGVDVNQDIVNMLQQGRCHIHEVGLPELLREQMGRHFFVAPQAPEEGDVFVIAVGTPVSKEGEESTPRPKLHFLLDAVDKVAEVLKPGGLVILRSTVPIGTTREIVLPRLEEKTGLKGGIDFHLAFAPERTVEGRALQELRSLPQVIGGLNEDSVEATAALFRELTPSIVRVSSLETAEMCKLINNSFRDLIFAFSNEVAQRAAAFNLDAVEAIRAANQGYPRDPVPLPSPGVGGPCLSKDPYILADSDPNGSNTTSLFAHGRRVNEAMHDFVAQSVIDELERNNIKAADATILVCGLAFKGRPETGDLRNSSAISIVRLLQNYGCRIIGHDPVAGAKEIATYGIEATELKTGLTRAHAVMFLNNHPYYEKQDIFAATRSLLHPRIVYDGWHAFEADDVLSSCPSIYMGLGFVRNSHNGTVAGKRL